MDSGHVVNILFTALVSISACCFCQNRQKAGVSAGKGQQHQDGSHNHVIEAHPYLCAPFEHYL